MGYDAALSLRALAGYLQQSGFGFARAAAITPRTTAAALSYSLYPCNGTNLPKGLQSNTEVGYKVHMTKVRTQKFISS